MYRHIWAEINLDALQHNITQILNIVPPEQVMGVIKANAYGHGAGAFCEVLQQNNINKFAVSNVYEALDLRQKTKDSTILILGNVDPLSAREVAENNITVCVFSTENATALNTAAKELGVTLNCHIKLDTGMGRLGFNCKDVLTLKTEMEQIFNLKNLNVLGAFTHFATADRDSDESAEFVAKQYELFKTACGIVSSVAGQFGKENLIFHSSNSAATLLDYKTRPSEYYRAGIILYGLTPSQGLELPVRLKPVMSLKATVAQVKTINKGDTISYGRTFKAKGDMKVATVTAGYADGYSRNLSNKGYVLIRGQKAPIVGRVCMDQMVVDVTNIKDVRFGDTVTLFGEGLPVEELAGLLDTINYELVCNVAHRVARVYIKGGEVVKKLRYLSV